MSADDTLRATAPGHDLWPYRPITAPGGPAWPDGKRLAVYVAVGLEEYRFGVGRTEDIVPDVAAPDLVNTSWRDYGNRVGAFRLLERLDRARHPADRAPQHRRLRHRPRTDPGRAGGRRRVHRPRHLELGLPGRHVRRRRGRVRRRGRRPHHRRGGRRPGRVVEPLAQPHHVHARQPGRHRVPVPARPPARRPARHRPDPQRRPARAAVRARGERQHDRRRPRCVGRRVRRHGGRRVRRAARPLRRPAARDERRRALLHLRRAVPAAGPRPGAPAHDGRTPTVSGSPSPGRSPRTSPQPRQQPDAAAQTREPTA